MSTTKVPEAIGDAVGKMLGRAIVLWVERVALALMLGYRFGAFYGWLSIVAWFCLAGAMSQNASIAHKERKERLTR